MNHSPSQKPELVFSLNDLWLLVKRAKWQIAFVALVFATLASAYTLTKPLTYLVEGSFKEGKDDSSFNTSTLQALAGLSLGSDSKNSTEIMLSRRLLAPLAQEMHLQGRITPSNGKSGRLKNLWENIRVTYGELRKRRSRILLVPDPSPDLLCEDIAFSEEFAEHYEVSFQDHQHYLLSDRDGQLVGEGKLGEPFHLKDSHFTLKSNRIAPLQKKQFNLTLTPLTKIVKGLQESILITPNENASNILNLSFKHRDRHFAAELLNRLMWNYHRYLQEESYESQQEQLAYLSRRQEETEEKLKELMLERRDYLLDNLDVGTFTNVTQEISFLSENQNQWNRRLVDLLLDKKMLEMAEQHPEIYSQNISRTLEDKDLEPISQILLRYRDLKQNQENVRYKLARLDDTNQEKKFAEEQLEQIDSRLKILKKRFVNYLSSKKGSVAFHEELISEQLKNLNKKMAHIPDKWVMENMLELQGELGIETMKNVSKLVESAIIQQNIFMINSAPFDLAIPPTVPVSPRLVLLFCVGACLGAFFAAGYVILRDIQLDLPVTEGNLRLREIPVIGSLKTKEGSLPFEQLPQSDQASLRKGLQFILQQDDAKRCLISTAGKPNFSYALGTLFAKKGERVILVECCANSHSPDSEGIATYLLNSEPSPALPTINKSQLLDYLPFGEKTDFIAELFLSKRFSEYLSSLEQEYDRIILNLSNKMDSPEVDALIHHVEAAIIALDKETTDRVKTFYDHNQSKNCAIAMILVS